MRLRDPWLWTFAAGVLLLGMTIVLADDAVPFALIVVPLLLSALRGRLWFTIAISAWSAVVGVIVLLLLDLDEGVLGRRALILIVAGAVAVAVAWTVSRWQSRARDEARRYRLLAENVLDAVLAVDRDGRITWASPSTRGLLGRRAGELLGDDFLELVDPRDRPAVASVVTAALGGTPEACEARLLSASAGAVRSEVSARSLDGANDLLPGVVIGLRNIELQARARDDLRREIEFDALTGLAKRDVALDRIGRAGAAGASGGCALILVGVTDLTAINHAYSHRAGDAVLQWIAERLIESVGGPDRVARVDGDVFAVIMCGVFRADEVVREAERLLRAVRGSLEVPGGMVHVTASAGLALAGGEDPDALLGEATEALRQAKREGAERWAFAASGAGERARQSLTVQSALGAAVRDGAVTPWFMPVVELQTGRVTGYECLMRWELPDGSVREPDSFLAAAESSGLIRSIDRTIFDQALVCARQLPPALHFGLNVSAATLAEGAFATWMPALVEESGLDPTRLHLEVTETSLVRVSPATVTAMTDLVDRGFSWWVDDFGTGFSSFSHLRDLPIAGVKLDRSFTADVADGSGRPARLARGLAGLAEGLGLETVAEGVETPEQAAVLARQGWRFGQGWYFGRPMPISRLAAVGTDA